MFRCYSGGAREGDKSWIRLVCENSAPLWAIVSSVIYNKAHIYLTTLQRSLQILDVSISSFVVWGSYTIFVALLHSKKEGIISRSSAKQNLLNKRTVSQLPRKKKRPRRPTSFDWYAACRNRARIWPYKSGVLKCSEAQRSRYYCRRVRPLADRRTLRQ